MQDRSTRTPRHRKDPRVNLIRDLTAEALKRREKNEPTSRDGKVEPDCQRALIRRNPSLWARSLSASASLRWTRFLSHAGASTVPLTVLQPPHLRVTSTRSHAGTLP